MCSLDLCPPSSFCLSPALCALSPFEITSLTDAGFKLTTVYHFLVLLTAPPECWYYKNVPPRLAYAVLGTRPMASPMPGKYSTKRATPQLLNLFRGFLNPQGGRFLYTEA